MDFEEYYLAAHRPLLRLCYLATLDVEAAADAAQEALARAWSRWDQIVAGDADPGPWVRTVALNLCRSRWRRLKREVTFLAASGPETHPSPRDPDPELHAALRRLPLRQREAIALRYWADLTVQECASAMGTSPGSVKKHLHRARARLQQDLAETMEVTL
jgi:RNA polymerase sigma-70 factor (ECF subfamily)